jgi:DNA-binding NarL/FixJ family response regulator
MIIKRSALQRPPARVLLVDDHGIVRDALTAFLNKPDSVTVVGTAADGKEAILAAARLNPDVIVMDLMMPELGGLDALERILGLLPQSRVIILSACSSSEHVFRALRTGARGYVIKAAAASELLVAVDAVMAGERYLSSQITGLVIDAMLTNSAPLSPIERLSRREREVLHLTVTGNSSADIASKLSLSRTTVDTYRSRLMAKLDVPDRAKLIHFAIEHALVST